MVAGHRFPEVCDLHVRVVAEKEINDIAMTITDGQSEDGASLFIVSHVDVGTGVLKEALESDGPPFLRCPPRGNVDAIAHRWMGACEDFVQLVHAIVTDEMREILDVILRLNLAKQDVLVRGTVHGAQESCDFGDMECNELAYELHVGLIHLTADDSIFLGNRRHSPRMQNTGSISIHF